ncbi:hypothetical protein N866_08525 [Actinotalea ferrariae CF5-4]|uniref:Uncharacterized protein n=1 Tax=Actinotalea ferrariae CF5-4 TaxID=948458 RepID=A0A021VMQ2_9CELL|nr:hypothetical protein N866_08525 [Actinotalea ferrariae CF5-4]
MASASVAHAERAARVVLAIALIPNAVFLVRAWIPELLDHPILDRFLEQVSPLVVTGLVSDGLSFTPGQWPGWPVPQLALLLGAVTLWAAGTRRGALAVLAAPAAGVIGLAGVVVAVTTIAQGRMTDSATAALLGVLAAGLAARTAQKTLQATGAPRPKPVSGTGWLVLYLIVFILPLAVGRAIFGQSIGEESRRIVDASQAIGTDAMRMAALENEANLLLYAAGACVGVVIWAAVRLLPPWRGRSLVAPLAVGVLALGLGVTAVGGQAREATDDALAQLRDHPSVPGCQSWWRESDPEPSIHLTQGCIRAETYLGHRPTGTWTSPTTMGVSGVTTPEGTPITSSTASALYGDVLVVAAAGAPDVNGAAVTLLGLRLTDAQPSWQFQCAEAAPFTVRFAATSNEEPNAGRISFPDEPPSVVVGCPEGIVRLDPATGAGI